MMLSRRQIGLALAGAAGAGLLGIPGAKADNGPPPNTGATADQARGFLIYYGSGYGAITESYSPVVLEDHEGAAALVKRFPSTTFLCYFSVAEVHSGRPYYARLKAAGIVGTPNPSWPDARYVDVRSPIWRNILLTDLIPAALAKGYRGVFLDTLDSAEALEHRDPVRFAGMVTAAADLVSAIRKAFPAIEIMINRAYAILPRVAGQYNHLLGESVRSTFGSGGKYRRMPEQDIAWQRDRMFEARMRDPSLQLFSLDYWDPNDHGGIARIYAEARADGMTPYVATPDLTQVVPEPSPLPRS
jgi:polysaccharide biosynthesis protein PelA